MDLYSETTQILRKYGIRANKSLGQNFLIDEDIVNGIVESADIGKDDLIIEIGPGLGTLTKELIKFAGKVIAIELDLKMINILKNRFAGENNLEIIHGDILKLDLMEIIRSEFCRGGSPCPPVKVVANLPYYITTPIIMKLLENMLPLESITVMIQKEVAQRLVATPGSNLAGVITYAIHYYCKPETLIDVPSDSFIPSPEVESSVIRLNVLREPSIAVSNEQLFFKIIKQAFSQRRKTLVNTLTGLEGLDKIKLLKMLETLNIDPKIRGEKLTMEEYKHITEYIYNLQIM